MMVLVARMPRVFADVGLSLRFGDFVNSDLVTGFAIPRPLGVMSLGLITALAWKPPCASAIALINFPISSWPKASKACASTTKAQGPPMTLFS